MDPKPEALAAAIGALDHRVASLEQRLLGLEQFQLSTVEELGGIRATAENVRASMTELKVTAGHLQASQEKMAERLEGSQEKMAERLEGKLGRFSDNVGGWIKWGVTALIALGLLQFVSQLFHGR